MSASAITSLQSTDTVGLQLLSLPTVVGFYFASRLSVTYLLFQSDPQLGAMASLALNIFLLVIACFYSFGPSSTSLASRLHTPCFRWVVAFLGFSLCSLVWSETVSVAIAFAYWLGMAADVIMVVLLLRTGQVADVSLRIIKGYVGGACFIAVVMWLSPTMQDLRPGNDDFFSPNAIGFTCAFGALLAQFLSRSERAFRLPAVFLAISLLRTLSKTTIAAFIAGELVLLARDKTIRRRSKVLLLGATGMVIAAFWGLISAYYDVYTNAGNQAETLTGRIGIWAVVLERSLERPWIGHGFHSFRNVIPPFGSFEAWHAHNELLQQFYAYGLVGIVLLIGLYGSFYRQLRRVTHPANKTLFIGLIVFIAVRGIGDTERFDLSLPLWSIALFSLMLAALDESREVSQ